MSHVAESSRVTCARVIHVRASRQKGGRRPSRDAAGDAGHNFAFPRFSRASSKPSGTDPLPRPGFVSLPRILFFFFFSIPLPPLCSRRDHRVPPSLGLPETVSLSDSRPFPSLPPRSDDAGEQRVSLFHDPRWESGSSTLTGLALFSFSAHCRLLCSSSFLHHRPPFSLFVSKTFPVLFQRCAFVKST